MRTPTAQVNLLEITGGVKAQILYLPSHEGLVQRGVPFLFFIKVPYRPAVALFRRMVLDSLASEDSDLIIMGCGPRSCILQKISR